MHTRAGHKAHRCAHSFAICTVRWMHVAQTDNKIVPSPAKENGYAGNDGSEGWPYAEPRTLVESKGSKETIWLAEIQ